MLDHLDEARRKERSDRNWHLSSLWSVLGGQHFRRQLRDELRKINVRSWRACPSVYEEHDDATRLLMVGAALNAHTDVKGEIVLIEGEERERRVAEWLESHPHEAEWLVSIGCTPADARRQHEEWLERTDAAIGESAHVGLNPT